jgi:protein-disulfide isomerase
MSDRVRCAIASQRGAYARQHALRTSIRVAAAVTLAVGCAAKLPQTPESPTAAVVGSRTITLDDVDAEIRDALFQRSFPPGDATRLFEARQAALDRMVDDEVVAQAAKGSGLAPEAWLEREVEARQPISEQDIDAFWKQYEQRLPKDRPEETIRADIRDYLLEQRKQELVSELRSDARVRMVLARPRYEVEPAGQARGPDEAPVVIVEFSDFQCPYCLRATATIEQLLARYPEEIRFHYRHLPLPSHARARPAAIASVCAARQGLFWAYHDVLFENQRALSDEDLERYAEQVGADTELFEACLTSPEAAADVEADMADAAALGVTGTPVFFVNGIRLKGAQPIAKFTDLIDHELARTASD